MGFLPLLLLCVYRIGMTHADSWPESPVSFLVSLGNPYAFSFVFHLVYWCCSCWPLTTVLPSCLLKNTVTEAMLLACSINMLLPPSWQACSLAVIYHISPQLLVLTLRGLHIMFMFLPYLLLSFVVLSFALPATQARHCAFLFLAGASLHVLPQVTHTLIHTVKLPTDRGQTDWKPLIFISLNYLKSNELRGSCLITCTLLFLASDVKKDDY